MLSILIIDDDEVFQYTTKRLLEKAEIAIKDISSFFTAEEALVYCEALITKEKPMDLVVLLDINLPGMDGWAFLNEWGKIPGKEAWNIALFMVSSSINKEDALRAEAHPEVRHYYTKPLTLASVMRLLDQGRQLD